MNGNDPTGECAGDNSSFSKVCNYVREKLGGPSTSIAEQQIAKSDQSSDTTGHDRSGIGSEGQTALSDTSAATAGGLAEGVQNTALTVPGGGIAKTGVRLAAKESPVVVKAAGKALTKIGGKAEKVLLKHSFTPKPPKSHSTRPATKITVNLKRKGLIDSAVDSANEVQQIIIKFCDDSGIC